MLRGKDEFRAPSGSLPDPAVGTGGSPARPVLHTQGRVGLPADTLEPQEAGLAGQVGLENRIPLRSQVESDRASFRASRPPG